MFDFIYHQPSDIVGSITKQTPSPTTARNDNPTFVPNIVQSQVDKSYRVLNVGTRSSCFLQSLRQNKATGQYPVSLENESICTRRDDVMPIILIYKEIFTKYTDIPFFYIYVIPFMQTIG